MQPQYLKLSWKPQGCIRPLVVLKSVVIFCTKKWPFVWSNRNMPMFCQWCFCFNHFRELKCLKHYLLQYTLGHLNDIYDKLNYKSFLLATSINLAMKRISQRRSTKKATVPIGSKKNSYGIAGWSFQVMLGPKSYGNTLWSTFT